VEPDAGALRHQPHAEEIAELQRGPVAPRAVRLRRAQFFRERVGQYRFGVGMAHALGQSRNRIETIDGDLVTGRYLRPQAGLPEPVERTAPEGDDVRKQDIPLCWSSSPLALFELRLVSVDRRLLFHGEPDVVEAVQQAVLAERIDLELYLAAVGTADFLVRQVDGQRRIGAAIGVVEQL